MDKKYRNYMDKKYKVMAVLILFWCMLLILIYITTNNKKDQVKIIESEQITLNLYSWEDERNSLGNLVTEYMKKNPHVTINTHFIPTSEYGQGLSIALHSDKPVDIFCVSKPSSGAVYVKKDQAIVLDDLFQSQSADLSGFGTWFQGLELEGHNYMMPYRMSSWVVYYNKDIFDRFAQAYPRNNWTWEEYAQIAQRLTDLSGDQPIYGSMSFDLASLWWRIPARTMGAEDPREPDEFEALLNAAKWCYDLTYNKKAQRPYTELSSAVSQDYNDRFLQGNIAMFFGGEWSLSEINEGIKRQNLDLDYDVAPMPHWKGEDAYGIGSPAVMMIAKKSKKQKASFDFLKFACGKKGAAILAKQSFLPAWNSEETKELFSKSLEKPAHSMYFFEEKEQSLIPPDTGYEEAIEIMHENIKLFLMQEKNIVETKKQIKQDLLEAGLIEK